MYLVIMLKFYPNHITESDELASFNLAEVLKETTSVHIYTLLSASGLRLSYRICLEFDRTFGDISDHADPLFVVFV